MTTARSTCGQPLFLLILSWTLDLDTRLFNDSSINAQERWGTPDLVVQVKDLPDPRCDVPESEPGTQP